MAPGVEPASCGRVDRRGKLTLDVALADINRRCRLRDRRQQRTGVRVSRVFVELVGVADLADLAEVHHDDAIGHVLDDREIVTDEQQREAVASLHVLQDVEDLGLHRHVECGHRLVADQHLRIESERTSDTDALELTTRELVRAAFAELRVDPDRDHQFLDAFLRPGALRVAPHRDALADDVADLTTRVERRDRVLEDHLQIGTDLAERLAFHVRKVVALVVDASGLDVVEANDRLGNGGLAATRFAHDAEGLAFGDVEADAAHGMHHLVTADGELDFEIPDRQEDVVIVTQRSVSGTGH